MGESIKEIQGKIKHICLRSIGRDRLFLGILLVLTAGASYGLGLASATDFLTERTAAGPVVHREHAAERGDREITSQRTDTTTPATYVGSVNSDKYHFPWCSGAERIGEENKIVFNSKDEARAAGYVPAGNCKGLE